MRIKAQIDIYCPSGFYCKTSSSKCTKLRYEDMHGARPFCDVFYPYLNKDSKGKILKCEQCLLAEREERKKA